MIDRDAFGDRVQQRRLAGARRRDDQRALAVADRRDEIDRAAGQLGAALRRTSRLEIQLPLGIRRGQRVELGAAQRALRAAAVDRRDLDQRGAAARIAARRAGDQVALSQCRTGGRGWAGRRRRPRRRGSSPAARRMKPPSRAGSNQPVVSPVATSCIGARIAPAAARPGWRLTLVASSAPTIPASAPSVLPLLEAAALAGPFGE